MKSSRHIPIVLTIAGSDSGGGAGIQADLKTFASLGVHGTSVVTCVTAQNPREIRLVEGCSPRLVREQLRAVLAELPPSAVKVGMLHEGRIIRVVRTILADLGLPGIIIDPVMVATSGRRLLEPGARRELEKIFALATLITPNLDEAAALLGGRITSVERMRGAARKLQDRFGCAVLLKGGHLHGGREAVDVLRSGSDEYLYSAPFVRGVKTHGTGCTYSAAIAAGLAKGLPLAKAVAMAKEFVTAAIVNRRIAGRHPVLWNGHPECAR